MIDFTRICPVFPVREIAAALEHYKKLGFDVRAYEEPIYGYVKRGAIEFHITCVSDLDPKTNTSAAYLYVDDANALYDEWKQANAAGRLHKPVDTDYGLREFAHVDPDGNLLRIGSKIG